MINFTDKEIEYLKGEVKEAYNMLNGSDEQKEIMEFVDDEDRALINKFVDNPSLWDKVGTDEKVNKNVENICYNVEGMANWWLRGYDEFDVIEVLPDCPEEYSDIYAKLVNCDAE